MVFSMSPQKKTALPTMGGFHKHCEVGSLLFPVLPVIQIAHTRN